MRMAFTFTTMQSTMRCLQSTITQRQISAQVFLRVKGYSRWTHRKPSKIVKEKDLYNDQEHTVPQNILQTAQFAFARRQRLKLAEDKKENAKIQEEQREGATLNNDGTPIFTKLDRDDPIISSLMQVVRSRKKDKDDNRILLEGFRLIEDAIKAGCMPEIIIFSRKSDIAKISLPKDGVKLYKLPYQTIQLWSDLTVSPGIMGIFVAPDVSNKEPSPDALPITVICDNVREPGNLGAILRVAAGVGCERVILTKGCVDLWNPKVLRSAAGAHFRVPIYKSQTWSEVQYLISENANIFVADNNSESPVESNVDLGTSSSDSSSSSDSDSSDSEAETDAGSKEGLKNTNKDSTEKSPRDAKLSKSDENADSNEAKVRKQASHNIAEKLPVIPYFGTEYTSNETIIIVGGETEGLSPESVSLATRRDGMRVNVPLTNGVDSLNTGTALGILLFEIKRQFLSRINAI
ncbi:rRNA methyltransferase 3, mitochondrial [Neodiprion pinetum]|uniref:rRNA methyltransferase 3, mitochondrial n=1 Tax=Neodiprion pinetum TaxID=441929 RepID=UPI001EDFAFE6|nr:rRNA methyltransferase 3, mitochondrial [Neodiprion pinetum]